jgi:hypothetical protein
MILQPMVMDSWVPSALPPAFAVAVGVSVGELLSQSVHYSLPCLLSLLSLTMPIRVKKDFR